MSCSAPIADDVLVAYWANDLEDAAVAEVDEHVFACDACFARSERVAMIAQAFRGLPPIISQTDLDRLRGGGATIVETSFAPGERKVVTFARHVDVMVHRLGGLPLGDAERVEVITRSESGAVMFEEPFAPFDRERGEILIACQRHFAVFPRDVVFDVRVHRRAQPAVVETFFVPHEFET